MPNPKKLLLLIGDIFILYLSLGLTLFFRYEAEFDITRFKQHFWPFTIIYLLWLIIFFIAGLYNIGLARNNLAFYSTLIKGLIINAGISVAFFYFIPYFGITPKTNLFLNLIIFALLFTGWRQLYNHFIKSENLLSNTLIIGHNKETQQIIKHLKDHPQFGYRFTQEITPNEVRTPFDLLEIATQKNIKTIVTAIDPHQDSNLAQGLYQCLPLKINFYDLPSFYEKIMGKIPLSSIGEIWFLENLTESQKNFYENTKRILDMIGAFVLGIMSLPLYPLLALIIKIDSQGPVFYTQKRISQDGQVFTVIKLRTMIEEAEKEGAQWAHQQDHRITRVGRLLRKVRLDELPQFWNIFNGQMSFIGPRPERVEFIKQLEKEIPYYQIRHIIKPGLTGWAQVNFRYGASVEDSIEKLRYELYYVKHRSFVLDISILLKTIKIVLQGGIK